MGKQYIYDDDVEYDDLGNEIRYAYGSDREDWEIEGEEFLKSMDEDFPGWSAGM